MKRPGIQLTHEVLVEEARFILRTLLRDDLFGKKVKLTEAERVLDSSISLTFADYCGFLNKYGYVRVDQLANVIEVTDGGAAMATSGDDPEFQSRVGRHFARELGTAQIRKPVTAGPASTGEVLAPVSSPPPPLQTSRPRSMEGSGGVLEEIIDRRYRRGAAIGAGPIGSVYEGEHIALSRPVVIKEARGVFQFVSYLKRDEIVRRLRTAVQKQASLVHPNIVQVLDQNHEREFPYFVMEHAPGGNLRRRMNLVGEGKMPLPVVVRVLTQICYALRFAHKQRVLHLDLKPENVLFDGLGNVKLADFGFGRITDRTEEDAAQSQIPVLVGSGTVGYMAPERLQPDADPATIGPQADVYSVGMLCYEILTGKLPGRRSPLPSQARKDVPAAFDDVFDRMTRDELSERYRTVDDALAGIYKAFSAKDVFSEGTILLWAQDPAPPPEQAEAAPPPASNRPEPAAAPAAPAPAPSGAAVEAAPAAAEPLHAAAQDLSSEATTGEVDARAVQEEARAAAGAPTRLSKPPPPPPPAAAGARGRRKEP